MNTSNDLSSAEKNAGTPLKSKGLKPWQMVAIVLGGVGLINGGRIYENDYTDAGLKRKEREIAVAELIKSDRAKFVEKIMAQVTEGNCTLSHLNPDKSGFWRKSEIIEKTCITNGVTSTITLECLPDNKNGTGVELCTKE